MSFTDFAKYNSEQLIMNSGRILLNAKSDSLFFIANQTIALSAKDGIHINAGDRNNQGKSPFIVNAGLIQFGLSKYGDLQPIAKGTNTVNVFNEILGALKNFSTAMSTATGVGVGVVNIPMINAAAQKLMTDITNISKDLKNIESDVTYSL